MKAERKENNMCSEEGQRETSANCRGTQLITGTLSPAMCYLSSHPVFNALHNKRAESCDFI